MRVKLAVLGGLILGCLATAWVGAQEPSGTLVSLEKAVHFTSPGGEDVVAAPGRYQVEQQGEEQIRLVSDLNNDALTVKAEAATHNEPVTAPVALSVQAEEEDIHHLVLLLPEGKSLDAMGSYSGIRSRQALLFPRPLSPQQVGAMRQSRPFLPQNNPGVTQIMKFQPLPVRPMTGQPQSLAIRDYLDGLPRLALVQSNPGTPQAMVGLPEGITGTQLVGGQFVNAEAELTVLKTYPDITWPGALVQGMSIANNDFAPIILPRAGGRVRLATSFVSTSGGSQFRDISAMNPGDVENATRAMLQSLAPTDSVGTIVFNYEHADTLREAMVKLGIAYKGPGVSASLDTKLNTMFNQSTIVAKFTQVFYTVAFDPDPNSVSPFFTPAVTLTDIRRFATPPNPPLFVSEVKYGRVLLVKFSSTMNKFDLEAAVRAAYLNVTGSVDVSYLDKFSKIRMDFLSVGSTGGIVAAAVQAQTPQEMLAALRNAIVSGVRYSPSTNPGSPIAFTMRYVGSTVGQGPYAVAIAQMVTQASPQVVSLNSTEVCKGVYHVWDGPGGGLVDTGIDANPGDKIRIEASGWNWSGVFATGDYGPEGWATWEAPGDGGRGYPIVDRPPFALIAAFGGQGNTGVDRTKWGYNAADGKQPSDWFFVGGRYPTFVAGDADRQNGRGTPGYGRIYLGTNDNNPTNGDPNKRFAVTVCFTRKPYS